MFGVRTRRFLVALSAAGISAALAAGTAASSQSRASGKGSLSSNLCTLKVVAQVRALSPGARCRQEPVLRLDSATILGADWGPPVALVSFRITTGVSRGAWLAGPNFVSGWSRISLGTDGHLSVGKGLIGLETWVNGAGLLLYFSNFESISKNRASVAGMLALARVTAKQI